MSKFVTIYTDGACSGNPGPGGYCAILEYNGIEKIVKGYRTEADLPWEREQAEWNMKHGGYETELWKCREEFECVSSTAVREKLDVGDNPAQLLHPAVTEYIKNIDKSV